MANVSREMHQRGLVVAAVGIFLGVLSQASLTDAKVYAHQSGKSLAGDLKRPCGAIDQPPSPRVVAPAFSQGVQMARFDVRTASK